MNTLYTSNDNVRSGKVNVRTATRNPEYTFVAWLKCAIAELVLLVGGIATAVTIVHLLVK